MTSSNTTVNTTTIPTVNPTNNDYDYDPSSFYDPLLRKNRIKKTSGDIYTDDTYTDPSTLSIQNQTNFGEGDYETISDKFDQIYNRPKYFTAISMSDASNVCKNNAIKQSDPKIEEIIGVTPDSQALFANINQNRYPIDKINPISKRFIPSLQPDLYTYSDAPEIVNSNIGITDTNSLPTRIFTNIVNQNNQNNQNTTPIFYRGEIKKSNSEDVTPIRKILSLENTNENTTPIMTKRYTHYSHPHAVFYDNNTGRIEHLYQEDPDSYSIPSIITRSNADRIVFQSSFGEQTPVLQSQLSLDEVKQDHRDQYMQDTEYFRNDLSERLMRRNNAIAWQQKYAPLSSAAHLRTM